MVRGAVLALLVNQLIVACMVEDKVTGVVAMLGALLIVMHFLKAQVLCTWPLLFGTLETNVWNIVAVNCVLGTVVCLHTIRSIKTPTNEHK